MVKVSVPATSANLGPGFDTLGVALELRNEVEIAETGQGVTIQVSGGNEWLTQPDQNLVYRAAMALFQAVGYQPRGLLIRERIAIPVARGLGSSAAAIVAGLVAADRLVQEAGHPGLSPEELLRLAVQLEGHPDNVTPALLGGFTIAGADEQGRPVHLRFDPPPGLMAVVVIPELALTARKTEAARRVLPEAVALKDAVHNLNRTALLVGALAQGRSDLLRLATQDRLHQPYRASLVPGLAVVFQAALDAGALGVVLSGAGPSVLAFVDRDPEPVIAAMTAGFQWAGSESRTLAVALTGEGIRIV